MNTLTGFWFRLTDWLDRAGDWLPALVIRVLLAWEYFESGLMKQQGENWFAQIQEQFPFPFDVIPVDISWFLATWSELIGAVMIFVGLFTRFWVAAGHSTERPIALLPGTGLSVLHMKTCVSNTAEAFATPIVSGGAQTVKTN